MDKLKQALGQDDGSDDMKKNAKLKVLKELRSMASGMMGDDVKDGMMKKVSVAAPNKEGLKKGLETAQEMVGDGEHEAEGEEDSAEEEASESPEHEAMEMGVDPENCTPEELDHKIAVLEALKAKKHSDTPPGGNPY